MQLPKELTTVTPLSKFLALLLFILLPILGFVFGTKYQKTVNSWQYNTNVISNSSQQSQNIISSTPAISQDVNPDSSDSRSIQEEMDSVFINFSICTVDERQIYVGFGSTTIAVYGKNGNTCLMKYGGEIENPNWNGELPYTCNVPQTLGTISFPVNNYGVNFQTIDQYCSK